jgi:hypothetical protein
MTRAFCGILVAVFAASSIAMADDQPTPEMMEPVEKIARFIANADDGDLSAFASHDVVIVENFAPYVFDGPHAVQRWAEGMRSHVEALGALAHRFSAAQDFSTSGDRAYFSLPTQWTGRAGTQGFIEDGGWSFVLVKENGVWRVLGYGWAVTKTELVP